MAAYLKDGQWRYKLNEVIDGRRVRASGTPSENTRAAAERAEREHAERLHKTGAARIGRPPAAGEVRDCMVAARVTKAELIAVYDASGDAGLSSSDWARAVLLEAAAKQMKARKRRSKSNA